MNKDKMKGRLDELTAKVKQQWGDLTDDEVLQAKGNLDEISAKIQQKYGESKEVVARKLNEIIERFDK
ncbi:CsbD family protein [Zhongshania sp.]|jgi:uncharacterized protein YjbJ (UPF0337 family)|uniref:CsbD family protein n=1 Tax=Zhongshania sp. TaxID=1971902 RepID=UPI0039E2CB83